MIFRGVAERSRHQFVHFMVHVTVCTKHSILLVISPCQYHGPPARHWPFAIAGRRLLSPVVELDSGSANDSNDTDAAGTAASDTNDTGGA